MGAGLMSSCAVQPPQLPPPVPLDEAQVKTAAEAQFIALRWVVRDSSTVRQLRLDQVQVYEAPTQWQVYIRRRIDTKPGVVLIAVDKRTAVPAYVPLK